MPNMADCMPIKFFAHLLCYLVQCASLSVRPNHDNGDNAISFLPLILGCGCSLFVMSIIGLVCILTCAVTHSIEYIYLCAKKKKRKKNKHRIGMLPKSEWMCPNMLKTVPYMCDILWLDLFCFARYFFFFSSYISVIFFFIYWYVYTCFAHFAFYQKRVCSSVSFFIFWWCNRCLQIHIFISPSRRKRIKLKSQRCWTMNGIKRTSLLLYSNDDDSDDGDDDGGGTSSGKIAYRKVVARKENRGKLKIAWTL